MLQHFSGHCVLLTLHLTEAYCPSSLSNDSVTAVGDLQKPENLLNRRDRD